MEPDMIDGEPDMTDGEPYLIDKPLGATPLETLHLLRAARPTLADAKLSYAGRLDPMASGLLVALHGPLLLRQESFWGLPKEYEATIVFGLRTDSHDLLGLAESVNTSTPAGDELLAAVQGIVGKQWFAAPQLASAHVSGRVRRMVVSQIDVLDVGVFDATDVANRVTTRVPLVRGVFRQTETLTTWDRVLRGGGSFPFLRLRIACSAGTYIRSLAHELGKQLNCGGVLADLRRTRVGGWHVDDPGVIRVVY